MPGASAERASRTEGGSAGKADTALQALHLVAGQLAPLAGRDAPGVQPRVADAFQPAHGMAYGVAHAAHLAVAALVEGQLDAARCEAAHARGSGSALLELDSGAQPVERRRVRVAGDLGAVHLLDLVARVREPVREL